MKKEVRVEIYGQDYSIRTELEEGYIQGLARTVDAMMHTLAKQTGTVDTRRLAVLVALNLADEVEQRPAQAESSVSPLSPDLSQRLQECHRVLEAALTAELEP